MHSGQRPNNDLYLSFGFLFTLLCIVACNDKKTPVQLSFETPYQGQNLNLGAKIDIKLNAPEDYKMDSVTYLLDGELFKKKRVADVIPLPTEELKLGYRMITAIVDHNGTKDTLTTNVVVKSNIKPAQWKYRVVNTFPHDTSAYTQGLSYINGKLLESTGEKGASKLRYVELNSGKVLKEAELAPQYFGEGSVKIGDKIIMLTWRENQGFVFDANTFKQLHTFPYQNSREGWGLTFDGKRILRTDGSNKIWFMNAKTYKEEGYIEVYDNNGAITNLNELEYIDGKIYANVYLTNQIVVINPISGAVEAIIDAEALVPKNFFKTPDEVQNNVLNGIAWDDKGRRLFVGGKKWPKLYEIKLDKASAGER